MCFAFNIESRLAILEALQQHSPARSAICCGQRKHRKKQPSRAVGITLGCPNQQQVLSLRPSAKECPALRDELKACWAVFAISAASRSVGAAAVRVSVWITISYKYSRLAQRHEQDELSEVRIRLASSRVNSDQYNSDQVNSDQVKSDQVKSNQAKPSQVKSSEVKSKQVKSKSNQTKSNQFKSTEAKPSQVKSSQSKSNAPRTGTRTS